LRNSKKILLLRPSHQTQKKQFQMKKLFAILAVAGFLTACGDSATEGTKPADSATTAPATTATPDSAATTTPDSAALKAADSAKTTADSAAKK
jgi:ABC-type uncharacterized transport system auxiliary subunit